VAVSAAGAARVPVPSGTATGQLTGPLGLADQQTTVVVQLAGDPITVQDANSANGLTDGQRASIRDQLRQQQAPVENDVRSHGGHILATYQAAYNGLKVQISASQAASLASLPGVVAVHPLELVQPSNIHGVPLIGAPQVWDGLSNLHGEGIKIADIDTGVDYTHADFGGSGNPADYQAALATDTLAPNPLWFGPSAPKVKGGIDLVGDSYNPDSTSPSYQPTPQPDPNPLDCNSHGTHTAGTLAGFGVLGNGTTYSGPYNATTVSSNNWLVGPGVAPKADLYAVKIFGCSGPTNEVIDAIEWAVDNHMDVINMSLGAPFGSEDSPDAVAAENAAHDGVIVVAASGNNGGNAYVTSDPASGDDVISVAANDPTQSFPSANMTLTPGGAMTAINANGWTPLPSGAVNVRVIYTSPAHTTISLGCSPAADTAEGPIAPNTYIVVARGTCARVAKAIYGQQAGAAGVIMVNSSGGFPPYEGPITVNPDNGTHYTVTIPFLGVQGGANPTTSANGQALIHADGGTVSMTGGTLTNPGFESLASFSSFGPRSGDSFLKPNVTAPGVSIFSAGMGTGTGPLNDSGTSMATPHTAGEAALVKQAHPSWRKVKYWDAAIENTADPSMVSNYSTAGAGTGFIQALPAVQTQVVALGDRDMGVVNFGFNELTRDFNGVEQVRLTNFGNSWATFSVADSLDQGAPHSVSVWPSTVSVPPGSSRDVIVKLSVPVATAGGASQPGLTAFNDVAGVLVFTPSSGSNNNVTLRVPYYMVPQAVSNIQTQVDLRKLVKTNTATALTTNFRGAATGSADWYDWGIKDKRDHGLGSNDIQAAGVSSFPSFQVLQFAISTNHRWSNAAQNVFDVLVDVNNDGHPDYDVEAADLGLLTTGQASGVLVVAVFDLHNGNGTLDYFADAPTDSNTIVMPVDWALLCDAGQPCLTANAHFTYTVQALSLTDNTLDTGDTSAMFNYTSSAVNNGMFDTVAPNTSATETLTVNPAEQAVTPALGWMVVSHENKSREEAQLIPLSSSSQYNH
jgi:subtilisin family serine protease